MVAIAREIIGRSGEDASGGSSRGRTRRWFARGATTELEAIASVASAAPGALDLLVLTGISVSERVKDGFECDVDYGAFAPKGPAKVGESSFSFDVATQSQRIVVPLQPQIVYPRSGLTAPSDSGKWLIGQQGDGSPPEGVDAFEPTASFSETHYIAAGSITAAYQRQVMRIVGKLNQFSWRGWAAEELMCTGVSGSQRGADDWEVSFRFAIKEHQSNLTVAGISGINKKGWQFLWPRYELEKDAGEPILSNHVQYIVVADVFRLANFTSLGIGF